MCILFADDSTVSVATDDIGGAEKRFLSVKVVFDDIVLLTMIFFWLLS